MGKTNNTSKEREKGDNKGVVVIVSPLCVAICCPLFLLARLAFLFRFAGAAVNSLFVSSTRLLLHPVVMMRWGRHKYVQVYLEASLDHIQGRGDKSTSHSSSSKSYEPHRKAKSEGGRKEGGGREAKKEIKEIEKKC